MTVAVSGRAVIDLGARASVLDAVDRITSANTADEVVLSVAAGAPVLRSPVFLEVARRAAGARRIALVTPDARARSLAAAVHMPAFASVAALERHELDITEPLGPARRAAIVATQTETRGTSPFRVAGVAGALVGALLVFLAVVGPSATVVVAPVAQALGPLEYDLRAGPNSADINAITLGPAQLSAKITGTATGTRTEETKATGVERFTNSTTGDVRIPKGTVVQTADNIRFVTTEDKTLPKSQIQIFPPNVSFGTVDIAIEAVDVGTKGNVAAGRINQANPSSSSYSVTNPNATSGGDSKKFAVITVADYQLAASKADAELRKQADAQVATWTKNATKDQTVYGVLVSQTGIAPGLADVVNRDAAAGGTFDLTVTGTATAYSVASAEPRATTLKKLVAAADEGYDIDAQGAAIDPVGAPTVDKDGVHWRVRARASEFKRLDDAAIRAALAGRPFEIGEITRVVESHGVQFRRALAWPGFWPRMPLLDSRIQIQKEAPPAASP